MTTDPLEPLAVLRAAAEAALEPLGLTVRMFAAMIETDGPPAVQILCTIDPDVIGKTVEAIESEKKDAAAMSELEESFRQQDHDEKVKESMEAAQRLLGRLKKNPFTDDPDADES